MQLRTLTWQSLPELKSTMRTRPYLAIATAVALLLLFAGLFAWIQFATPGLAGNDGYYHVKMGYLIREQGLTPAFEALPFTILNAADYYDHHLLFHVYLALFAPLDPAVDGGLALTQGAKLASILMPALAFLAIWWMLRAQEVPFAAVWALGLFAVSEAFLYRMSMPRAQSLALLLLALALHWLLTERYLRLLPLGFIFVWAYNAFPLLLVVAGVYAAAVFVRERRIVWQAVVYPAVGIGLGVIVNPYFPQNVDFILQHVLPKLGEETTKVGNEWSAYRTDTLLGNSGLALAAVVAGALALGWRRDRIDAKTLTVFGLAALFGYMLFTARRFVEYFPPFALIFLALAAAPLLRDWLAQWHAARVAGRTVVVVGGVAATTAVGLLLAFGLWTTGRDARELVADSKPETLYAEASLWLRERTAPGDVIFQTDWDDFTRQFFYNSDVAYINGLDPTFMQLHDAALFDLWRDITRGEVERPGTIIRDTFGARFVFSDLNHDDFLDVAAVDPALVELYRTEDAVIFQVVR